MSDLRIAELETPFVFRDRPEAIPGDLRPIWRIGQVLLVLHMASRGGRSSFARLHVLNWALHSEGGRESLFGILDGQLFPGTVVIRIEPSLNRAVDYALGEDLVKLVQGDRIQLTIGGRAEAQRIMQYEGLYERERKFLHTLGKRVTEKLIVEIFRRQDL